MGYDNDAWTSSKMVSLHRIFSSLQLLSFSSPWLSLNSAQGCIKCVPPAEDCTHPLPYLSARPNILWEVRICLQTGATYFLQTVEQLTNLNEVNYLMPLFEGAGKQQLCQQSRMLRNWNTQIPLPCATKWASLTKAVGFVEQFGGISILQCSNYILSS